jgi:photosystem II stability/assembly factor-like uncharacterized protein
MEWPFNSRKLIPTLGSSALTILLILICGPFQIYATGTWTSQRSGTMSWLRAVYFLNESNGWAVGGYGTLLTTNDGGRSWQRQKRPTEDALRDIYFVDENSGWIVCERDFYKLKTLDEPRSYLLKTTNSGKTWTRINVIGKDADVRLVRVIFADKDNGWVFGEEGAFYVTNNGGTTWTKQRVPTPYLLLGGTLLDKSRGWLVGAGSTILQTEDSGLEWRESRLPVSGVRLNAVTFINKDKGWAVGSGGTIIHTSNGGRSWQVQASPTKVDLLDVKFINEYEGWAVGAEGSIVHTVDAGQNWSIEASDTKHQLERAYFIDKDHGWAVGFGGTIILYRR